MCFRYYIDVIVIWHELNCPLVDFENALKPLKQVYKILLFHCWEKTGKFYFEGFFSDTAKLRAERKCEAYNGVKSISAEGTGIKTIKYFPQFLELILKNPTFLFLSLGGSSEGMNCFIQACISLITVTVSSNDMTVSISSFQLHNILFNKVLFTTFFFDCKEIIVNACKHTFVLKFSLNTINHI